MIQYVCSSCGYSSVTQYGKCPECHEWNSMKKFSIGKKKSASGRGGVGATLGDKATFQKLDSVKELSSKRLKTDIYEYDRVLGGGYIAGEVILLAGEPGVGKSTLLLSIVSKLPTVYISGEESGEQIKHRAERMKVNTDTMQFSNSNEINQIIQGLEDLDNDYDVVIVDSVQTLYAENIQAPFGSVSHIKETASRLVEFAKTHKKVVIIVGHVTKDGDIAGPKTLEHIVDCVMYLEGEKQSHYRILRAHKNRFGPTDEVGIFEMTEQGLVEVDKPASLLGAMETSDPGRALVATVEGSRALFYEIQSLVVPTSLAVPRRIVSGVDYNRLQLLLAVMKKHMKLNMDSYDIYVNVVGGLTAKTPAADLGIIASVLSSAKNITLPNKTAYIGEVGLLGEVRPIYRQEKVLADYKRFDLQKIISSHDLKNVREMK